MSESPSAIENEPLSGKEITDDDIYRELLRRSGGKFTGDSTEIEMFEPIYRKLHTLGQKLGDAYLEIAHQFGDNPGKVNIVLGGGRAKGSPFKEDSDLDVFFYVENPKGGLDSKPFDKHPDNPWDAVDERTIKQQRFLNMVSTICTAEEVRNKFHILGFGSDIPDKYDEQKEILLATTKTEEK